MVTGVTGTAVTRRGLHDLTSASRTTISPALAPQLVRAHTGVPVGNVIKKRRKKMRKHKKRKLLRRARHKRKK